VSPGEAVVGGGEGDVGPLDVVRAGVGPVDVGEAGVTAGDWLA